MFGHLDRGQCVLLGTVDNDKTFVLQDEPLPTGQPPRNLLPSAQRRLFEHKSGARVRGLFALAFENAHITNLPRGNGSRPGYMYFTTALTAEAHVPAVERILGRSAHNRILWLLEQLSGTNRHRIKKHSADTTK